jgi:hypothetical protein
MSSPVGIDFLGEPCRLHPRYRDRTVLHDGSVILYDSRTERWTVSSTEEVAASDCRRTTPT